jgi:hypothetical protein
MKVNEIQEVTERHWQEAKLTPSLVFPDQFQGFFSRTQAQYAPLLVIAREEMVALNYPTLAERYYSYVVSDNPQPSFMLCPLMFLGLADASGGVTPAHRAFLPILMLVMEMVAVMDDTADRTPVRSGRPTFPATFGEDSATPFVATLVGAAFIETAKRAPALIDLLGDLIVELGACELWEMHHRYPQRSLHTTWLHNRYEQARLAFAFTLDSALRLNGHPPLPHLATLTFARISQDVDDVVNLVETREHAGENDDFKMGIVTRPLVEALNAVPKLTDDVYGAWAAYAAINNLPRQMFLDQLLDVNRAEAARVQRVHATMQQFGVPATLHQMEQDAQLCIAETPAALQPIIEEMVQTFVERLENVQTA